MKKKLLIAVLCYIIQSNYIWYIFTEEHISVHQKNGESMINIGINDKNRKQITTILNNLLANEFILYTKTLNFHWNVEGHQFHDLHEFFKELYEKLFDIIDDVAERARTLGAYSFGSCKEFIEHASLNEVPGKSINAFKRIQQLLDDHEAIIRQLREDVDTAAELHDIGTNNFLTDIMEKHEKVAWMLRSHLVNNK